MKDKIVQIDITLDLTHGYYIEVWRRDNQDETNIYFRAYESPTKMTRRRLSHLQGYHLSFHSLSNWIRVSIYNVPTRIYPSITPNDNKFTGKVLQVQLAEEAPND